MSGIATLVTTLRHICTQAGLDGVFGGLVLALILLGCSPFNQQSSETFLLLDNGAVMHSRFIVSDSGIFRGQGHIAAMLWRKNQTPIGAIQHSTAHDVKWNDELRQIGSGKIDRTEQSLRITQTEFNLRINFAKPTGNCEFIIGQHNWSVSFGSDWSNGWLHASGSAIPMRGLAIQVERSGPAITAPLDELIVAANPSKQLLWVQVGNESHGCLKTDTGVRVIDRAETAGPQTFRMTKAPANIYGADTPYSDHTILDQAVLLANSTPTQYLWKHIMISDQDNRWSAMHRVAQ